MRRLLLVGLSHRTAPVTLREQLAIPSYKLAEALRSLRASVGDGEAVVLSTCNRVELYVAREEPMRIVPALIEFLSQRGRLPQQAVVRTLYYLTDQDAVAHLFRVAPGLDSMVLGESEITAQVKSAYLTALSQGTTGPFLNRLFQKALHCAKLIRSQTHIAEGQASIGSVVVKLARQCLGNDLAGHEALVWGAGKAACLTAHHLIKGGIRQLWVVNRTQAKSQDLATLCQSGWVSWEQGLKHLAHVDIAIVCTQAPHYVIDAGDLETILPQRRGRPLCLIDLAVPRNVDPTIAQQPGVHLYNIDRLQVIAQRAFAQRQHELERCEAIIQGQVSHLLRGEAEWQRRLRPTATPSPSGSIRSVRIAISTPTH